MANPEHTRLAKQGPHAIARWREQRYWVRRQLDLSGAILNRARLVNADLTRDNLSGVDLTDSDLHRADLCGTNLRGAHLWRSNLSQANLRGANMAGASLVRTNLAGSCLQGADLRGADLSFADLSRADLEGANLSGANLTETDLSWANLNDADLRNAKLTATVLHLTDLTGADLRAASLFKVVLDGAKFSNAVVEMTLFADCDLSQVVGLDQVQHHGPSIIGADSLTRSGGYIPDSFLRQAGVEESLIGFQEQLRNGVRRTPRVLLVSALKDGEFAARIQADLRESGTLCWSLVIDDEDAFRLDDGQIKRVTYYDCLALVCSTHSLESPYACRLFEQLTRESSTPSGQAILPIAIDDLLLSREDRLCSALRQAGAIDFRGWEQGQVYKDALKGLVEALF